jgi:hypothetical protein
MDKEYEKKFTDTKIHIVTKYIKIFLASLILE